jgi:MFS family permease
LTTLRVVQVWHIIVLASLLGIVNAFDMPARQSFVIEIASREDLLNAVALNSTAFNSARIIGPAIAGILIGTLGSAACFFINGVSFIAVIVSLLLIDTKHVPRETASGSIFSDMIQGLRYIKNHRVILTIISMVGVFSIFGMPYTVLMPVFAKTILHTGAKGYGLLMTATGVGAVVGALILATLHDMKYRGRLILIASIIFVVGIDLFAVSRLMALSVVLLVLIGFAMVSQAATANTLLQTLAPDDMRGRVMSVFGVIFMGFAPIGSLQAGFVAQHLGAPMALILGSVVMAITIAVILILRPEVRSL